MADDGELIEDFEPGVGSMLIDAVTLRWTLRTCKDGWRTLLAEVPQGMLATTAEDLPGTSSGSSARLLIADEASRACSRRANVGPSLACGPVDLPPPCVGRAEDAYAVR